MNAKVFILRGIPGSGKSTVAAEMQATKNKWDWRRIVSADSFMVDAEGNHSFDWRRLGECHAKCMEQFISHCQENNDLIIVDNSNIRAIEVAPYVAVANAFQLPYTIITIPCLPEDGFRRGIHNVPLGTIEKMHRNLVQEEKEFPQHWNYKTLTNFSMFNQG